MLYSQEGNLVVNLLHFFPLTLVFYSPCGGSESSEQNNVVCWSFMFHRASGLINLHN